MTPEHYTQESRERPKPVGSMRFDHLGLVVRLLANGRKHLRSGLLIQDWTEEVLDEINGVKVQFGRDSAGVCYELLEPLDDKSPLYASLRTGKAILNHVAYLVEDIEQQQARLQSAGWARTSDPKPAIAYGGRRIQFFVSPLRTVMELIEAWDHTHLFTFRES